MVTERSYHFGYIKLCSDGDPKNANLTVHPFLTFWFFISAKSLSASHETSIDFLKRSWFWRWMFMKFQIFLVAFPNMSDGPDLGDLLRNVTLPVVIAILNGKERSPWKLLPSPKNIEKPDGYPVVNSPCSIVSMAGKSLTSERWYVFQLVLSTLTRVA